MKSRTLMSSAAPRSAKHLGPCLRPLHCGGATISFTSPLLDAKTNSANKEGD
jgi:hypothetical protein